MTGEDPRSWLSAAERARSESLNEQFVGVRPQDVPLLVMGMAERGDDLNGPGAINLYAGTNVMDPKAQALLATGIATRPSLGHPGDKYEMGLQPAEEIEVLCLTLLRRVFGCRFGEFRVLSGSMANLMAYMALARPGDTMLSLAEAAGGHATHRPQGAAGLYGLKVMDVPFDGDSMRVDLDTLHRTATRTFPRIILIGGSLALFPYPVREIRAIADEVGAAVMYDGAHLSGLLAAGAFQRPLAEGAHVLTMSTYKSLGGPAGGLIVTDDPAIARRLEAIAYPGLTANFDLARVAALTVTLAGWLSFGPDYARAMQENAHTLALALATEGLDVAGEQRGYTASHHVAIRASAFGGGTHASRLLEGARIFASGIGLPGPEVRGDQNGMRFGTQEVTRFGMGSAEMHVIARLIADRLLARRDVSAIRDDALELRGRFMQIGYTL